MPKHYFDEEEHQRLKEKDENAFIMALCIGWGIMLLAFVFLAPWVAAKSGCSVGDSGYSVSRDCLVDKAKFWEGE